jgi:hypothetical protein
MGAFGEIDGLKPMTIDVDRYTFDEDDLLLYALLTDPIYCAELLWRDPTNREYGECYRVRDYQYPLWRPPEFGTASKNYAGYACARSTGKTESIKGKSFCHAFRRHGENLLVTAPELIHLLPLTDAIEERIRDTRLTREFLDDRHGKTGFTHRPFGVDFLDGTKIVGRIPRLTGVGVKGQHQPDLLMDEAQDYPERGWTEVHETVIKDHVDHEGEPDFNYEFYGVHSGARDSGFFARINEGGFRIVNVTAIQRPGWSAAEKQAAKAAYGGTSSSDYRRNILGEPGSPASAFFVTARLMACVDQDRESHYNQLEYVHQTLRAEELDELQVQAADILDLPGNYGKVYGGMDVGLTDSPTVITLFNHEMVKKVPRLKLVRRIHLERFRTRQIRETLFAIAWHFGGSLQAFGIDITGLGFPMFQEMEDDEAAPAHLMNVTRGYFFNAKVPVGVMKENVVEDQRGNRKDQYGSAVKEEVDPITGQSRFIVEMPMIEASTRYLREMVDSGYMMLPFDTEVTRDMQGETHQRVKLMGERKKKPNAFHILDAMRGMAMGFRADEVEDAVAAEEQKPVFDMALDLSTPVGGMT